MILDSNQPKIIVICGSTGIGKTSTAIRLAQKYQGEIISADSMQIYRLMDIGTAKPTREEQAEVPHHLIDIIMPDTEFDAVQYAKRARKAIESIHERGRIPFVVGGTGFYIKALLHGLFDESPGDTGVKNRLKAEADTLGAGAMHQRLAQVDPAAAQKLHPNDLYRIIRALEVFETTGRPISDLHQAHRFRQAAFPCLKIGLSMPREILYDRIDKRVDIMIGAGLAREVQMLLDKGYAPSLKSMQSIGYRHVADFLLTHQSWDETIRTLKRDTRRYAKRQMTWFKIDRQINWAAPMETETMGGLIETFLRPT